MNEEPAVINLKKIFIGWKWKEQVGDDESFKGRLFPVIKIDAFWGRGIKLLIVNVSAFSSGFCMDSLRNTNEALSNLWLVLHLMCCKWKQLVVGWAKNTWWRRKRAVSLTSTTSIMMAVWQGMNSLCASWGMASRFLGSMSTNWHRREAPGKGLSRNSLSQKAME